MLECFKNQGKRKAIVLNSMLLKSKCCNDVGRVFQFASSAGSSNTQSALRTMPAQTHAGGGGEEDD